MEHLSLRRQFHHRRCTTIGRMCMRSTDLLVDQRGIGDADFCRQDGGTGSVFDHSGYSGRHGGNDTEFTGGETAAHWISSPGVASLVGILQHAAYVVRPGRLFLRRIYDLLAGTSHFKLHYFVRLNAECRAWWFTFHRSWNWVAIIRSPDSRPPNVVLCTDASGSWGCGAFWKTLWF